MLHVTKSNIKNISQTVSKSRQNSFVKRLEMQTLAFSTVLSILLMPQVDLYYKLGNSRKLGLQGRRKLQIRCVFITLLNIYDGELLQK